MLERRKKKVKKNLTIVVDAGHGERDPGTTKFGLKEKDITLDIARRIHALLKKNGYRSFLTRNTDSFLNVLDRYSLARQLKADLFVSVHVNSCGLESVSGFETHYLKQGPLLGDGANTSFMFVQSERDKKRAGTADEQLKKKIVGSQILAQTIHAGIKDVIDLNQLAVADRGVKQTVYRTLLHHEVPASIVEVGFLTNKKEAQLLAKSAYRQVIAQGIYRGIVRTAC